MELVFEGQFRAERTFVVLGNLYWQITLVALESLGGLSIALVAVVPPIGGMLLVTKMIGHLCF